MSALSQALRLVVGAPWWAYVLVVFACLAAYICRMIRIYKIGSKALDKAASEGVPEIVASVAGHPAQPMGRRRNAGKAPGPAGAPRKK